jgi:hypothetical protein
MKRIPLFAGLALAVVLVTVTMLVRVTHATNDSCYANCSDAQQHMAQMLSACEAAAAPHTPTWSSYCHEATESGPGGYGYSCSWGGVTIPPGCYMPSCAQGYGGGFGGGNKIDPNDAACQ